MKTLITAIEVRAFAKTNQTRMPVETGAIITPAAWDEAKEFGITIELGATLSAKDELSVAMETGAVNPDFLARVVGEVIACLQKTNGTSTELVEIDPSGLKKIRGDRIVLSGDKMKTCELFGAKDGARYSTRMLTLENTSFSRDMECDETWHVLEGNVEIRLNGSKVSGAAGDTLLIPGGRAVTISTASKAKVFAVCS